MGGDTTNGGDGDRGEMMAGEGKNKTPALRWFFGWCWRSKGGEESFG